MNVLYPGLEEEFLTKLLYREEFLYDGEKEYKQEYKDEKSIAMSIRIIMSTYPSTILCM